MLMGRLTADPETRPAGQVTLTTFRLAVGKSKKNAQTGQWENDPNPLFIECEAWPSKDGGGLASIVQQYCRKGSEVFIEGRLVFDQWDDKNGGGKRSKHKITVDNVQFLGGKSDNDAPQQQPGRPGFNAGGGNQYHGADNSPGGEIPF